MQRCLKPGGLFRIQEPNADSLFVDRDTEDATMERPLRLETVKRQLVDAGLAVEACHTFLHFGMAGWLAEAGLNKAAMDDVIDSLNPLFDRAGQGEIFMIVGRKM